MTDWYAFLVEPGRERRLIDWLRVRQNYAQWYWPSYTGTVKLNKHRKGQRARGVIPGYVFIRSKHAHVPLSFRLILDHSCVHGVLRYGDGDFARITQEQIERIQGIEAALNDSVVAADQGIPFKVGQTVRLRDGVLAVGNARVVRIDNQRRVLVAANMFGRVVNICLPPSEIEAV